MYKLQMEMVKENENLFQHLWNPSNEPSIDHQLTWDRYHRLNGSFTTIRFRKSIIILDFNWQISIASSFTLKRNMVIGFKYCLSGRAVKADRFT